MENAISADFRITWQRESPRYCATSLETSAEASVINRHYFRRGCQPHFLVRLFCQNRTLGMGQYQDHCLGLLSRSAHSLGQVDQALAGAWASSDLRDPISIRLCEFSRRFGGRAARI